jgi:hypothetical protein
MLKLWPLETDDFAMAQNVAQMPTKLKVFARTLAGPYVF